jgi:hypothetical protein
MHKASGGKSFGNIRGQHNPKIAAGLLKSIEFDDEAKRIDFCANIVDDQEWAKVEEASTPASRRAAATPSAGPTAATPLHRRRSASCRSSTCRATRTPASCWSRRTAPRRRSSSSSPRPTSPATRRPRPARSRWPRPANPEADEAELKNLQKNYVGKARADLIAEKADEELAKMAAADGPDEDDHRRGPAAEPASRARSHRGARCGARQGRRGARAPRSAADRLATIAAAITGATLAKAATDLPFVLPSAEAVALIGADLEKSIAAVALIDAATKPLAKGLYSITDVACSLNSFSWIAQDVATRSAGRRRRIEAAAAGRRYRQRPQGLPDRADRGRGRRDARAHQGRDLGDVATS